MRCPLCGQTAPNKPIQLGRDPGSHAPLPRPGHHRKARAMSGAGSRNPTATVVTEPTEQVLQLWRTAEAVCFDVDSTLCVDESIDELAAYLGVGEQVAELTRSAMGGSTTFQEALASRLAIINPSRAAVDQYVATHPPQYSPGIPELVKLLQRQSKAVFLVSGGFHAIIDPIAEHLAIPASHVFANTILYKDDADGGYAGFDAEELTSRSGGKLKVAQHLKAQHGFKTLAAVGDGATDLEARQPGGADIFIGYGGAVYRQNVAEAADWYLTSIQPLIDALQ